MRAASSEQLSVRYGTKAHMNQKNRQISNIEKPGRDNRTKPLPVGLMGFLYCALLKGVIWVVSDCRICFLRRGGHVMWVWSLCWLVTHTESVGKGKVTSFSSYTEMEDLCVCFWEGMSGWAHHSAVCSYLLCHTDGSVSQPQTLPLQQKTHEIQPIIPHRANWGQCVKTVVTYLLP